MNETAEMIIEGNTEVEAEVKPYELRALCAKDIYVVSKIIGKIGIKNLEVCFKSEKIQSLIMNKLAEKKADEADLELSEADVVSFGFEVIMDIADVILCKLPSCEEYINRLLANLSGMTESDISSLPLGIYTNMIIDVLKMDGFKDFVQAVSGLKR